MAVSTKELPNKVDTLIVGSGFSALCCAVSLRTRGFQPIIIEKSALWGGTSATSLGVMWLPGHHLSPAHDSIANAKRYLEAVGGQWIDMAGVETFLSYTKEAFSFFENMGATKSIVPLVQPDYQPELPGGVQAGRAMRPVPFDGAQLGLDFASFQHPIRDNTAFNGLMVDGPEIRDFLYATRRFGSLSKVMGLIAKYAVSRIRYHRDRRLTMGAALTARMGAKAKNLGIPIYLNTELTELEVDGDKCTHVVVRNCGERKKIAVDGAVVLASGGFPHNRQLLMKLFPEHAHVDHMSLAPASNTGRAIEAAVRAGAMIESNISSPYAYMPVSKVPNKNVEPRIALNGGLDRAKPGAIIVDKSGRRFANEALDYHQLGQKIVQKCADNNGECYLICDREAFVKNGLGAALPIPGTAAKWERTGYLLRGQNLAELAQKLDIDPENLIGTVERYNKMALQGVDEDFGRGNGFYDKYIRSIGEFEFLDDSLGPLKAGPYYAIRLIPGDIGTFAGLKTDEIGRALRFNGDRFDNLYVVGNDRASVFGGFYPGPGITLGPAMVFGYVAAKAIAGDLV